MKNSHIIYHTLEELPLILHADDLAAVLGIGINGAYNLLRSNQIRNIRVGVQYLIPREAVIEFMSGHAA